MIKNRKNISILNIEIFSHTRVNDTMPPRHGSPSPPHIEVKKRYNGDGHILERAITEESNLMNLWMQSLLGLFIAGH